MTNTAVLNAGGTLLFEDGSFQLGDGPASLPFIGIGAGVVLSQPDPSSPLLHAPPFSAKTGTAPFLA